MRVPLSPTAPETLLFGDSAVRTRARHTHFVVDNMNLSPLV